jgi:hypothetical protein
LDKLSVAPAPTSHNCRGRHCQKTIVEFQLLASIFVQPGRQVGQSLFTFRPELHVQRLPRKPLLIGGARVVRDFSKRSMPGDRLDLRRAILR